MHIPVGSESTMEFDRVLAQILPAIRIIIPVQVIIKPCLVILPLVHETQGAIHYGKEVALLFFLALYRHAPPQAVIGLPQAFASLVEHLLGSTQMVGDYGIEARFACLLGARAECVRLLGDGVECPRLKVPAVDLGGLGFVFRVVLPLLGQGRPLPDVFDAL